MSSELVERLKAHSWWAHDRGQMEIKRDLRLAAAEIERLEAVVAAWDEHFHASSDLEFRMAGEDYDPEWPEAEREHKARMELSRLGQHPAVFDPTDAALARKEADRE